MEYKQDDTQYDLCPFPHGPALHLCKTKFFASSQMVNSSAAALFCQLHGAQLINSTDIVGIIEIAMNAMSCESSQYKLDDASSDTWYDHAICLIPWQ
ncbi:uncharacterized protein LOC142355281 [Convolutriloba macropyga]|uniref:uncharacterized protein LOC142355281 n=1 Tax=Convolutriloba macropyga TaxID=536237 RepID=UPI003F51DE4F